MVMMLRRQNFGRYMSTHPSAGSNAQSSRVDAQDSTGEGRDAASEDDNRRGNADRRGPDRRRSAKGLFELRARRDRVVADRRQLDRRSPGRFRLAFWRRGLDVQ